MDQLSSDQIIKIKFLLSGLNAGYLNRVIEYGSILQKFTPCNAEKKKKIEESQFRVFESGNWAGVNFTKITACNAKRSSETNPNERTNLKNAR